MPPSYHTAAAIPVCLPVMAASRAELFSEGFHKVWRGELTAEEGMKVIQDIAQVQLEADIARMGG